MNLLIFLIAALILIPLLLKLFTTMLPQFRDQLSNGLPAIRSLMGRAFRFAGRLFTDDGALSPQRAIAQGAGSILFIFGGTVIALCGFYFTQATLASLLGIELNGEVLGNSFDQLSGATIVVLGIVFGSVIFDLQGWTFFTPFARIERSRLLAYITALVCFFATIAVGVALAKYRQEVMAMSGETSTMGGEIASVQDLPTGILIPLEILLIMGVTFTFMSVEIFVSTLVAFAAAMGGVLLGILYLFLGIVKLLLEVICSWLEGIPDTVKSTKDSIKIGFKNAGTGLIKSHSSLKTYVRMREDNPMAPTKKQEDIGNT